MVPAENERITHGVASDANHGMERKTADDVNWSAVRSCQDGQDRILAGNCCKCRGNRTGRPGEPGIRPANLRTDGRKRPNGRLASCWRTA